MLTFFSVIRTGIVATILVAALAACAGQKGVLPYQTAGSGFSKDLAAGTHVATECNISPWFWVFGGPCVKTPLDVRGVNVTLKPYRGTSFAMDIGANNSCCSDPILVSDATGKGDITGTAFDNGTTFLPYGGKHCLKFRASSPTTCPGKAFLYVSTIYRGPIGADANKTPSFKITSTKGFPGKTLCFAALLGDDFSAGLVWSLELMKNGRAPVGSSLTIPSAPRLFSISYPGTAIAMVCK